LRSGCKHPQRKVRADGITVHGWFVQANVSLYKHTYMATRSRRAHDGDDMLGVAWAAACVKFGIVQLGIRLAAEA
jgi:hypothetical protein